MATKNVGFDNFFSTTLNGAISDSTLTIELNAVPTASEGFLVIDPDDVSSREVVYYTSKGSTNVVCPAGAGSGRGYDGTTARSHLDGATVYMAPVAAMWEAVQDGTGLGDGIIESRHFSTDTGELGGAWDTWTPTFSNLSGGTLDYANYIEIGKTVHYRIKYTLSGTNVSGAVTFTLPVSENSDYDVAGVSPMGAAIFRDTGSAVYHGFVVWSSSGTCEIRVENSGSTYGRADGVLSSSVPFTWADTDQILICGTYEAA